MGYVIIIFRNVIKYSSNIYAGTSRSFWDQADVAKMK